MNNTFPIAQTKIIKPMGFIDYLNRIFYSFYALAWLCNTFLGFNKYVMEPNVFLIYPKKYIAHALNNSGNK
jgi:hypothetical protein